MNNRLGNMAAGHETCGCGGMASTARDMQTHMTGGTDPISNGACRLEASASGVDRWLALARQ